MIFSSKGKFIFTHIHKCGGESIEYAFNKVSYPSDIILGGFHSSEVLQKRYQKKFFLRKHSGTDKIISSFDDLFEDNFSIYILIRDPIERAISTFNYLKQEGYDIAQKFSNPSDFWLSENTRNHGPDFFFVPQHKFFPTKKKYNLKVFSLNNIDKFIHSLNDHLSYHGYENNLELLHRNMSNYDRNVSLSSEAMKLIKERYAKDFALIDKYVKI